MNITGSEWLSMNTCWYRWSIR